MQKKLILKPQNMITTIAFCVNRVTALKRKSVPTFVSHLSPGLIMGLLFIMTLIFPKNLAALSVSVTNNSVTCNGGSNGTATAIVTGTTSPYHYLWNNGKTSATIAGLFAGGYTVTVTDNFGTTTQGGTFVYQPAPLTITVSATDSHCNQSDGTASATAAGGTPGYAYSWNNGANTSYINNLWSAVYTVSVTDANNCLGVQTIPVSTLPGVTAQIISSTPPTCNGSCNGQIKANGTGGNTPYTYKWSNGTTTQTNMSLCAGSYTVTITDSWGCSSTVSSIINQPPALVVSINTVSTTCYGTNFGSATANATGGPSPYTYSWSNGKTGKTINNLMSGIYSVSVTDNNGCLNMAVTFLDEPAELILSLTTGTTSCGSNNGKLFANVSGGLPPYTYMWSNVPGFSLINSISNLGAGTYTSTVTDINGCTILKSTQVTSPGCNDVWPGDANSDLVANIYDILPIGVGYNTMGTTRVGASNNWVGQTSSDWSNTFAGGSNYKHADCNGDGTINLFDVFAIGLNYGQTHNKKGWEPTASSTDPDIYLAVSNYTVFAGEAVSVPVFLGTNAVQANNIYGLAFKVHYDSTLIQSAVSAGFVPSWFGTLGTNMIAVQKDFHANGQLDVGMVRTNQNNVSR